MTTPRQFRNHLEMLQQTFANALTATSPRQEQPAHITTPLRMHQLATLTAMRDRETNLPFGWEVPGAAASPAAPTQTLFSQYAYLGDPAGTGKTLTMLGHLSQMATYPLTQDSMRPLSNLHPASTSSCFSIHSPQHETLYDSLLVVPHTLYRQWQDSITMQTSLKAHFLKSLRDLDKDSLLTSLQTSHCTLVSNTLLPAFLQSLQTRGCNPCWRRVVFDEPDTVKFSAACPRPPAHFTWFLSASFQNCLFANSYDHTSYIRYLPPPFVQSLDPSLQEMLSQQTSPNVIFYRVLSLPYFQHFFKTDHPLRSHLVIRSSLAFLKESIELPPLHQRTIECLMPPSQEAVEPSLPEEAATLLHAGDVEGAIECLGISSHTALTLPDAVTEYSKRELARLERLYQFKLGEEYSSPTAKQEALANLQSKITSLQNKIQSLFTRLQTISKDSCSICFEAPTSAAVVTPCCNHLFCGSCILSWMEKASHCPLCRSSFRATELTSISATPQEKRQAPPRLPQKLEALSQILRDSPDGRFVVFSRYENPLQNLEESLKDEFPVTQLQGNKDMIKNTLQDFESGKYKVLLLNSRSIAAGLHIPSATHVILLHKMILEEEHQILGRAYRLGRTSPLHFIKLLHRRELRS